MQLVCAPACDATGGSVAIMAGAFSWLVQVLMMSYVPE